MKEFDIKKERRRQFCKTFGYDGMYLSQRANFAWLSCGGNNTVERCISGGVADFFVTKDRQYVIASEIERYRIMDEELKSEHCFELVSFPWGGNAKDDAIAKLVNGKKIVSDIPYQGMVCKSREIAELRYVLTEEEESRIRLFASESAANLEAICHSISPGMTEYEAAAELMAGSLRIGGDAPVVLVAFDEIGRAHV